jgi:hypothetical protein
MAAGRGAGRRARRASSARGAPGAPRAARVVMGDGGAPREIDGRPVEQVRESWLVEDRWWTGRSLRRRYWEVVSAEGRNLVAFHDLDSGHWFTQAG